MKEYFKDIRNYYHVILGITIAFDLFILFNINLSTFPINKEHLNNLGTLLLGGIFAGILAFFWEKRQEQKYNAPFDKRDVVLTMISGVLGGVLALLYPSYVLLTILTVLSVYLVTFHEKK
jgi:H+/Cl- antiporter ClcA